MSYFPRIHGVTSNLYTPADIYTDLDGNVYTTVDIGSQRWIVENFRCTKYADSSPITKLEDSAFNDYFLPSRDELQAMYDELFLYDVGDFDSGTKYWSSSEANATDVYLLDFSAGDMETGTKDVASNSVRACRSFQSSTVYALRDTGPAGGLIFYVEDLGSTYLYFEAATEDQAASTAWSNVTTPALGTTGTGIGDGEDNTTAIIAQEGHTASAAKLCADVDNLGGWINDTTGAYCAYNNDDSNIAVYGLLYNWYAANHASVLAYIEYNGVEDAGWRVMTDADRVSIRTALGGTNALAGAAMKEAGFDHWNSPNTGATNSSGFTGRGAGYRDDSGDFYGLKTSLLINTTAEVDADNQWAMTLVNSTSNLGSSPIPKKYGCSVRLVKDI